MLLEFRDKNVNSLVSAATGFTASIKGFVSFVKGYLIFHIHSLPGSLDTANMNL